MKNKSKTLTIILSLAIAVMSIMSIPSAYASDLIAINSTNFADKNFRSVVEEWFDEDNDGYLSESEISGVTLISISGMLVDTCGDDAEIQDLKGIEYFTSCLRLRCGGIGLTSLDVSAMPQLVELTCAGNSLTSLDVSQNTNLQWLNCSSNDIEGKLDISTNTALTRLDCYVNGITELDLSHNTALTILRCQRNELTELDLSQNTAIDTLNCSNNHLTALDLSLNTKLAEITESNIGDQTVDAEARIDSATGEFLTALSIKNWQSGVKSTSLDTIVIEQQEADDGTTEDVSVTKLGYNGTDFFTTSLDNIVNGIDYYYNTGLEDAEAMSVHINVLRDFYQVKFYTDEGKQTLISSAVVENGSNVTAPEITSVPQCKIFDSWSDELTNITEDKEIYVIWADDHNVQITKFADGVVYVNCTKCENQEQQYVFAEMANTKQNSKKYVALVDINNDGVINGKDYAKLLREYK